MSHAGKIVVGLGELLWDLLPNGPALGGAPANVAYWASQLGDIGIVASRVGQDASGVEAVSTLAGAGVTTEAIQRDPFAATGAVEVTLSAQGQPTYRIVEAVAWDELAWTPTWQSLAERADAVCFGTLAQRSPRSRATIGRFVTATRPGTIRLLDLNLRAPFWSRQVVEVSLRLASAVKLNDAELPAIAAQLSLGEADEIAMAQRLRGTYDLDVVCLTRGAQGSVLISESEIVVAPGQPVDVVDTVGAGDAFSAALIHHLLRGASLATMAKAANALGGWVATQRGAMPVPNQDMLWRDVYSPSMDAKERERE